MSQWNFSIQDVLGKKWLLTVTRSPSKPEILHNEGYPSEAEALRMAGELRTKEIQRREAEITRLRGLF